MSDKQKKILLTGGGTGGSVTPLLALAETLNSKSKEFNFLWVGTNCEPEREMTKKAGINFKSISSGKLRRYFSVKNFFDIFKVIAGFFQSILIIIKFKPNLIVTAGSFVSVPIIWAGWLLGKKIMIHQQDIRPGLANKLMAPFADVITVSFKESLKDYGEKAIWTGSPARISDFRSQISDLEFKNNLPLTLIVGGGTGAEGINELVTESVKEISDFANIVHVTGKNKISNFEFRISNYKVFDFLEHDKIMEIMKKADLVVSRAGMGFLTEISYLKKSAIIIPMPDSHQEENAKIFSRQNAAAVLNQKGLTPKIFTDKIRELLSDEKTRKELGENAGKVMKSGANEEMTKIIISLLSS